MEVKTENGGTFDAAGNGTKGISIAGLVTGTTALIGSGLLGMFGVGKNGPCNQRMVSEVEFNQEKQTSALMAELQKEKSERYTDQAIIDYNKDKYEFNRSIADAIVQDRERLSSLEQHNECMNQILDLKEQLLNQKIEGLQNSICSSVALEAERRMNGDQNLYNYANATFVPGKLVMPLSSICPSAMPQYNSWTAPTTPTTGTGTGN